ncbi:hypothetical protein EV182_005319 [Spiromyces aspiralis]|uniref:Uncharacterized protein n=1 Tax=Spiromyces aspiralis TaxID=68401 RepID=A0ACC1HBM5_9FUNG|nr:hypothetical protein EV182_005319 [Spiromyces aspiralis]
MSSEVVADNTAVGEIDGLIFKVIHANFGHKDHAVVAFSGISIILSTIVIVGVITHIFYIDARKCVYFRISATLAFCNIVYGLVQILLFDNKLTNRLTDIQLRSLYFLYLVSLCSIILNTCCIALHLHLTTITTNLRIAIRISPFYELMSWTIAGIICHPVFYTFYQMKKIPISGAIVIFEKSWSDFYRHITCISCFYILGLVYCAYVCIEVIHRLLPIWIRIKRFDTYQQGFTASVL